MFKEQKLVGLFPIETTLSYFHFLFFDELIYLGDISKASHDSHKLVDLGVLKLVDTGIDIHSIYESEYLNTLREDDIFRNSLSDLSIIEGMRKKSQNHGFQLSDIENRIEWSHVKHKNFLSPESEVGFGRNYLDDLVKHKKSFIDYRLRQIESVANTALINSQIEYIKSQSHSDDILLPSTPNIVGRNLVSNAPFEEAYMDFIDGMQLKFVQIAVPIIPIPKLLEFKQVHQDKLRAFRVSFIETFCSMGSLENTIEKMAVALKDYNDAVQALDCKYSLEKCSLISKYFNDLIPFILSDVIKALPKGYQAYFEYKKRPILKDIESLNIPGREVAYFYEIDNFFKEWRNK